MGGETTGFNGTKLNVDRRSIRGNRASFGIVSALLLSAGFCAGLLVHNGEMEVRRTVLFTATFIGTALLLGWFAQREVQRLQNLAAWGERARIARELHDGLLQSLSVAALKLQLCVQLLSEAPSRAAEQLRPTQELLAREQENLRVLLTDFKMSFLASQPAVNIEEVLRATIREIEEQCELPVTLEISSGAPVLRPLAHEICQIVREGLFNVARHAHASAAQVEVAVDRTEVHLKISDNGRGFPFRGRYDHEALTRLGTGPVVLKSRVESLDGRLTIDSADTGANLEIRLPFPNET